MNQEQRGGTLEHSVALERVTHPAECEGGDWPALPAHFLSLNVGVPVRLSLRHSGQTHARLFLPGEFLLMPAQTPSRWQCAGATETLFLQVPPLALEQIANDCGLAPENAGLVPRFGVRDLQVARLGAALEAELHGGHLGGRLYAETLSVQLALHLLRCHSASAAALPARAGPGRRALRRAVEYLHEHFTQDITLSDLADAAGLSEAHFARQFKQAVGLAPHQYLIQCRVDAAKPLLLFGSLSVGEAAHQVGFGSQSQFSRHFKRLVGVTPQQFKK